MTPTKTSPAMAVDEGRAAQGNCKNHVRTFHYRQDNNKNDRNSNSISGSGSDSELERNDSSGSRPAS